MTKIKIKREKYHKIWATKYDGISIELFLASLKIIFFLERLLKRVKEIRDKTMVDMDTTKGDYKRKKKCSQTYY